jgi:hypothetical protein
MVATREEAIDRYEAWIRRQAFLIDQLKFLRGKVLACWCPPQPCHGDVLIKLIKEFHP